MKCLYNMCFLKYFILIYRACLVCFMDSFSKQAIKLETINYSSSFWLHKRLIKNVYKLIKLIQDQRRWFTG